MKRASISLTLYLLFSVFKEDLKVVLKGRPNAVTAIGINCYRTREF